MRRWGRRRRTTGAVTWLLLLGLVAASCGAGQSSEGDYVDALVPEMEKVASFDNEDDSRCVAQAYVEMIGLTRLQNDDVTPESLAKAENVEEWGFIVDSDEWWESANECTDVGLAVMTHLAQGDEIVAQCLMDSTTDADRKTYMYSSFELSGDEVDQEVSGNFSGPLDRCREPGDSP